MANLLMVTGDRALAQGRHSAFYNTLDELRNHFDHIDIICPDAQGAETRRPFENIAVYPSSLPLILQPLYIVWRGLTLSRQRSYAIMTVHEYPPFYNGIGAFLLHILTHIPYVLEIMHIPGYPRAANIKERIYRLFALLFLRFDALAAQAIRVINRHEVPDFLVRAGVPEQKIVYAPAFYIDLNIFKPADTKKEYDLLFVGRLAENKGIDLFLDAVERLPTARALIVGEGPLCEAVKERIISRELRGRTKLYGFARDAAEVARLMNLSRVLVMPSYNEGGPRVVLEAMACGVPVVATRVGIVPDVVPAEFQCDWDSHDIVAKCELLFADEVLYRQIQEHGLKIANQFERGAAIEAYAGVLSRVAMKQP